MPFAIGTSRSVSPAFLDANPSLIINEEGFNRGIVTPIQTLVFHVRQSDCATLTNRRVQLFPGIVLSPGTGRISGTCFDTELVRRIDEETLRFYIREEHHYKGGKQW
jgi:sporulation-control protein spo0M